MQPGYSISIPLDPQALVVVAIVLVLFTMIVNAVFCAVLASEKGYGVFGWFVLGLLFGTIALIAAAGLPDKLARGGVISADPYRSR